MAKKNSFFCTVHMYMCVGWL